MIQLNDGTIVAWGEYIERNKVLLWEEPALEDDLDQRYVVWQTSLPLNPNELPIEIGRIQEE